MSTILQAGNATSGAVVSSDTAGSLQIQTGSSPTTAITVDTSQNVGIGTTSPSTYGKFAVVNGANYFGVGTGAYTSAIVGPRSANDGVCSFQLNYSTVSGDYWKFDSSSSSLATYKNVSGTPTELMRIDSSGNLLVGTTTAIGKNTIAIGNGGNAISVQNASGTANYNGALFYNNGSSSLVGYISVSGSVTSYVSISDYRLKENVVPMTGALAAVSALKPVTYKWKSDGSAGQGFIAHELQEVCPDAVSGEKDAVNEDGSIKPQGIDTSFLVATLTAAIQELNAKVDAQAAEIQALKGVA